MKTFIASLCLMSLTLGSLATLCLQTYAQTKDEQQEGPIICWYNEQQEYTGADAGQPSDKPGKPLNTGKGGDFAWSLVIIAIDGKSCPRKLPKD